MRRAIVILALIFGMLPVRPAGAEAFVRLTMDAAGTLDHEASAGAGPDTPFAIASVGKTMTAVAVLSLVDRGILSLDDPVADLLPPAHAGDVAGLRLSHLLTMTSGLPDYYTDDWFEAALAEPGTGQTVAAALEAVAGLPALFRPGRDFDYSNTNYVLLGAVLEEATGDTLADILRESVFAPAGMTDSFVFGARPLPPRFAEGHAERALVRRFYSGNGLGDGGVISTARDVARFYRAVLVDRRVLSDESLAAMLHDPTGAGYGMGIEIEDGIAGHSGGDLGYSSDARVDLETGHIAVELVAAEDADTGWTWDAVLAD